MSEPRTPQPWPEAAMPTPEQLADWLAACNHDERVSFARHALRISTEAARCFNENHAGRLDECEKYRRLGHLLPGL